MVGMEGPRILYEDNHLLAMDKPCGMATMGASGGAVSAAQWAAHYLKEKYRKPGNVFIGVVHRLDAAVSGVLVLARTSKAASRLCDQIRQHSITKRYLAVVEGHPHSGSRGNPRQFTELVHYLAKNDALHRMQIVDPSSVGAVKAILQFRVLHDLGSCSLLEIDLVTGRKHQIRVQFSAMGCPILGDWKYQDRSVKLELGSGPGLALHCHQMTIQHPTRREAIAIRSLPIHWLAPLRKRGLRAAHLEFERLE